MTTGVTTVDAHRTAAGHPASPPPLTVAVLVTGVVPLVGVTGMMKLAEAEGARPAGIVQVTWLETAGHPAGSVPRARVAGTASLTVAAAVVAVEPWSVTVMT